MDTITQAAVSEVHLVNQIERHVEKETSQWLEGRHIDIIHQQQIQQSFYKNENDAGAFNEPASQWWKDVSCMEVTQMQNQIEVSQIGYPLTTEQVAETKQLNGPEEECFDQKRLMCKVRDFKDGKEITKRSKHPEKWKVNMKKNARLRGEEYVGVGGKVVPAKIMGPPCKCRMRCSEKIDEAAREKLHSVFWKTCTWEQRKQYIALSVKESPKQRTRCRGNVKSEHRRQVTFTYSLLLNSDFITVCKCMFLSTFSVSEKFVRHAMTKKRTSPGGIIGPDQRGRHTPKTKKSESVKNRVREHIESFPAEKSSNPKDRTGRKYLDSKLNIAAMHKLYVLKCKEENVPECDIVKESYYREMFKTEFNLGFKCVKSKDKQSLLTSDDKSA